MIKTPNIPATPEPSGLNPEPVAAKVVKLRGRRR
jgi:hypothetical protein